MVRWGMHDKEWHVVHVCDVSKHAVRMYDVAVLGWIVRAARATHHPLEQMAS